MPYFFLLPCMVNSKNTLAALIMAIGLVAPQPVSGLEQKAEGSASFEKAQSGITSQATIDYIMGKIKEYNKVKGDFISGQVYTAKGYNEQLNTNLKFNYVQFGEEAVLNTVLMDKPYQQPASYVGINGKTHDGFSNVTFREHLNKGKPNEPPTIIDLALVEGKTAETPLNDRSLGFRRLSNLKEMYRNFLGLTKFSLPQN